MSGGGLPPEMPDSVLIMITVPRHWRRLTESEVVRALRHNQPHLLPFIAREIKNWQGVDALDLVGLQELIDERKKVQPKVVDA